MLSQFTREGNYASLADLDFKFSKDVYPVGRLDADSEGLLILTNDRELNFKLLNPENAHHRTYLAQVDGEITPEAIRKLTEGVEITVNRTKYKTLPARAEIIDPPDVPERQPPLPLKKGQKTSWLKLKLVEGKNRQVRKMTAAVGFPTLRLIRIGIEGLELGVMESGKVLNISPNSFLKKLRLK